MMENEFFDEMALEDIDREIDEWIGKKEKGFIIHTKPKKQPYTVIQGFIGAGISANMAVHYLLQQYQHRRIAGLLSDLLPPLINVNGTNDDRIYFPITIFELLIPNFDHNVLVTLGEVPIPEYVIFPIINLLNKTYLELNVRNVIHLDSFHNMENPSTTSPQTFVIGKKDSFASIFDPQISPGVQILYGMSAACQIAFREFDLTSIITEVSSNIDETATHQLLKRLSKFLPNLTIDIPAISALATLTERKSDQIFGFQKQFLNKNPDAKYDYL